MNEREITLMPLVQLPSGTAIRADKVLFIARQELGKYVAVMDGVSQHPILTLDDMNFLRDMGCIQSPPGEQPKEEPLKLATA